MTTERAHGTRARYVWGPRGQDAGNGCRCFDCSRATVLYEKRRIAARSRGEAPFVDTERARAHLNWLSTVGVGTRAVAERTGLARTTIMRILSGQVTKIRPATETKILAVHTGCAQPRARVPARRTLEQLDDLINVVGMTKRAIAAELGATSPSLQVARAGTRVTKTNADLVDALWRRRMAPVLARRENEAAERARYRARHEVPGG